MGIIETENMGYFYIHKYPGLLYFINKSELGATLKIFAYFKALICIGMIKW